MLCGRACNSLIYICYDETLCNIRIGIYYGIPVEIGYERTHIAALWLQSTFFCLALRPAFRLRLVLLESFLHRVRAIDVNGTMRSTFS